MVYFSTNWRHVRHGHKSWATERGLKMSTSAHSRVVALSVTLLDGAYCNALLFAHWSVRQKQNYANYANYVSSVTSLFIWARKAKIGITAVCLKMCSKWSENGTYPDCPAVRSLVLRSVLSRFHSLSVNFLWASWIRLLHRYYFWCSSVSMRCWFIAHLAERFPGFQWFYFWFVVRNDFRTLIAILEMFPITALLKWQLTCS